MKRRDFISLSRLALGSFLIPVLRGPDVPEHMPEYELQASPEARAFRYLDSFPSAWIGIRIPRILSAS